MKFKILYKILVFIRSMVNIPVNIIKDDNKYIVNIDPLGSSYSIKLNILTTINDKDASYKWLTDFFIGDEMNRYDLYHETKYYSDDKYISNIIEHDTIHLKPHNKLLGGKSLKDKILDSSAKSGILIYFSFLIIIYMFFFLRAGYLPIFARLYTFVMDFVFRSFYELPYIKNILTPFTKSFENSKLSTMILLLVKVFIYGMRSIIDIIVALLTFIMVYGFSIIGLFVPLFWIKKLSIQKALARSRQVSYILTMVYALFYIIVNFPLIIREFSIYLRDNVMTEKKSPFLNFIINIFSRISNFQLSILFAWIPTISRAIMTSRMESLEGKSDNKYMKMIKLFKMMDLSKNPSDQDSALFKNTIKSEFHLNGKNMNSLGMMNPDQMIDKLNKVIVNLNKNKGINITNDNNDIDATIYMSDLADLLSEMYIQAGSVISQFVSSSDLNKEFVYILYGYVDDEEKKEKLLSIAESRTGENIKPPSFAIKNLSNVLLGFIILISKPFYIYNTEIVPINEYLKYKMSGLIPGYFSFYAFIIAFIALAIMG